MFQQGQQIGSYTLLRKLGRGGFGEVWLAEKRTKFVTTKFALKLPHDDQIDHEAIRQEATLWEQASGHPNILPIIDADEYDGQVLIVSEFAPDGSLHEWLRQNGKMSVKRAVETTIKILDGLQFLHSRNIIHRDLKPANILLQGDTPRLADFGISRALRTTVASQSQHISGTFAYMSPEALDGKRSMQTDIWSVGVNLYQFLTGNLPYPQAEPSTLIAAIMMRDFEPLPDSIPPDLKKVVAKALAKLPENRYASAAEMSEDLKKVLFNFQHPSMAKTEVLQIPAPNNTITDVTNIQQLLQTEEPKKETVINTLETPIVTNPQKETAIPKPQTPIVTNPQIPQKSIAGILEQKNIAASNRQPNTTLKIGGIILGVFVLGLIATLGIGTAVTIFRYSNNAKTANINISSNSNTTNNPPVANGRLIPYRKGNKWGYADENKKLVIEAEYYEAKPFVDGLAIVNGFSPLKSGVIDKTGKEVVPLKYDKILPFKEDLAQVQLGLKYGFVDKTGKEIIPIKYDYANDFFSEGLVAVLSDPIAKYSYKEAHYIDKTDKIVIRVEEPKYHSPFSEGLAMVGNYKNSAYGDCGFIDKTGNTIIPFKFRYAQDFKEGLAPVIVNENSGYGFIDRTGKMVIQPKYSGASPFSEGLARVELGNKWGFIDKTGKEVIMVKYKWVSDFNQGLAVACLNDKCGVIDKTGKEIIPFKYGSAYPVEDLFMVKLSGDYKEFYIDKNGTEYYEP